MHLLKQDRATELSGILELRGDELVLDVGCGLGKLAIGIAKNLKTGRVVGIDIWDKKEIPGNSSEKAYENAAIEGVKDKVEFRYGNVLEIPFPDQTFDLVTCGSVLNNLRDEKEKVKALREIHRVLKPRGKFLLIEPLRNIRGLFLFTIFGFWKLLSRERWEKLLQDQGFDTVGYQYRDNMGWFICEKH
jgi:ubiquinone/menaquinone biosynthesis C-methylase UbiE